MIYIEIVLGPISLKSIPLELKFNGNFILFSFKFWYSDLWKKDVCVTTAYVKIWNNPIAWLESQQDKFSIHAVKSL